MNDVTKVKTFTPLLPDGVGPTGLQSQDALYDIMYSIEEQNESGLSPEEFEKLVEQTNKLLNLDNLNDGEYVLFSDYKLEVLTMTKMQFDEMPEFEGY